MTLTPEERKRIIQDFALRLMETAGDAIPRPVEPPELADG